VSGINAVDLNTTDVLWIGGNVDGRRWEGTIDEVRIYNRAITTDEVSYNYNSGQGRATPQSTDGLVALWHMDEGTGGTIGGETANNNDGTIYGPAWVAGFPFPSEAPPEAISQIVFTNPERTVLVNEASEVMTIQARDAADNPAPVTENTTIALNSTSGTGEFSAVLDPWVSTSSVTILDTQSSVWMN